jgi:hypothetical protein
MQYHKAAFLGQERAKKAQIKLFDYAGFAMLTYTIKQGGKGFEPVGEEMFVGKLSKENEVMIFICDEDGYAKAQSRPFPIIKGEEIYKKMLADGIREFIGPVKTIT